MTDRNERIADRAARWIVAGVFVFEGARAIAWGGRSIARTFRRAYREARDRVELQEHEEASS